MRTLLCMLTALLLLPLVALSGEVYEPKAGSPVRTAIMDAMRAPLSKRIGKRVTFTGSVYVSGKWATFQGNVAPSDGKPPKGDLATELEFDYFALLKRDGDRLECAALRLFRRHQRRRGGSKEVSGRSEIFISVSSVEFLLTHVWCGGERAADRVAQDAY